MFGFSKSKPTPEDISAAPKKKWLGRFNDSLKRTRDRFTSGLTNLVLGKKSIDAAVLQALETTLLSADVGVDATQQILAHLTDQVSRKELDSPDVLIPALQQQLIDILAPCQQPLVIQAAPFIILMVGVNGVGKTTTIAKLAHYYQNQGKKVMLAAGDTFRAAAIEQLEVWGAANKVPVIAQQPGADSASVIFDAMQAATARNYDILIADTAGRLHTQTNLMAELQKIKRVMTKINPNAPHETMLVLDAGTGQNALNQAQQFHDAIGLTGLTLTKLDGTAKGGIIFALAQKMKLPIRFIALGEQLDDLKSFEAKEFVEALFQGD
jgi:fused signal recognition particle receptor